MNTRALMGLALAAVAVAAAVFWFRPAADLGTGGALAVVTVPELAGEAVAGETAFNANCASCHGANAAGRDGLGPPLVHKIYEPSHHGDMSFVLAATRGVPQHHWTFGDMPARPDVTAPQIEAITAYVRALQRANGIN